MNLNIEELADNLLWDKVANYVENINEFRKMVNNIFYIDRDKIDDIEFCEVFDSEEFFVTDTKIKDEKLFVKFEMPFILSCWNNNHKQLFRVTAYVAGVCEIPNEENFDYTSIDFANSTGMEALEVKIDNVVYSDVEVDSVYL